jgi:glycosyltransferase involved in cell wall biosynthesis
LTHPINVLLVPTSDYIGHPFPQRLNHIFEKVAEEATIDVHVARFQIFNDLTLQTKSKIHVLDEYKSKYVPIYYLANIIRHGNEICRIVKENNIDLIVLSNLAPALGYLLLRKKKIPVIYDIPDYFPTSASGYLSEVNSILGRFLTFIFKNIFDWIIKQSDYVSVASSALYSYVDKLHKRNVRLIPNGIGNHFLTNDDDDFKEEMGFSDNIPIIGYLGSLEFWLDLEPLFKAIRSVIDSGIHLNLLMIGNSLHTDYMKSVDSLVSRYELKDYITRINFVPYELVPKYIRTMDITLLPFSTSNPTSQYSAPNKLWEYLSQNKIVISTSIPEVMFHMDAVNIANTNEDYEYLITDIILSKEKYQGKVKFGYELSKSRTWDKSSLIMIQLIRQAIEVHK